MKYVNDIRLGERYFIPAVVDGRPGVIIRVRWNSPHCQAQDAIKSGLAYSTHEEAARAAKDMLASEREAND